MASNYQIADLKFYEDSEAEQVRTRNIFENLKAKALSGSPLTAHEKNFFCQGVKLSRLHDGTLEGYPCCDDYKFNFLYLIYFRDLTGGSKYQKVGMNAKRYFVPATEAQKDLEYLIQKAEEWDLLIQKDHTDELLLQVIVEARKEIKTLDKQPEILNDPYAKGRFYYRYKRWAILLHFKWLHYFGLEFFEATEEKDLQLEINNTTIEYSAYSLVHILNRHYSQITKQYESDKTFHIDDFRPRILSPQLKTILNEIDDAKVLAGKNIDKIAFKNNDIDYHLWTTIKTRSIKGQGNVPYRRVETFYPLADPQELEKLTTNYTRVAIREGLDVYVEN